MKLRHSGYIIVTAALAIALVSCGKKEDATSETPAATTAPAGQPVDAASAGTITGTIKLDGTPPTPGKISMAAEAYCASQHPTPVPAEDVVVGPGGVAYVVEAKQDVLARSDDRLAGPRQGRL